MIYQKKKKRKEKSRASFGTAEKEADHILS
jgi:hypothetical protein